MARHLSGDSFLAAGAGDRWQRPRLASAARQPGAEPRAGVGVESIRDAIAGVSLRMHFQPLVDLAGGRVVAYEALARFQGHPDATPDGWFRTAAQHGLREDLELAAVEYGLRALTDLRDEVAVCVNLSVAGMLSGRLGQCLDGLPPERIVLELTEQEEVDDYRELNRALLRFRADGIRLAVDDAGAGFASMKHIVSLQPDIIKLDASWVSDIDADPVRRAMVASLATFAASIDAVMVGEAVETRAQADVLRDVGVPWAQGYFFARPAPLAP
jgi:EAL domain-containing protein (putative c-di-GMP-specific phosphodiesterase class I)